MGESRLLPGGAAVPRGAPERTTYFNSEFFEAC